MGDEAIRIEVRFFASLAQTAGCDRVTVELARGDDVTALWRALARRHPGLGGIRFRPLVACDRSWAGWDHLLDEVREVAFLPPFSGG